MRNLVQNQTEEGSRYGDRFAATARALAEFNGYQISEGRGVLDIFSGAGGMSAGFAAHAHAHGGLKLLGGVDIDEAAIRTYRANFGHGTVADVRDLARSGSLENRLGISGQDVDILIGCPPCQGFTPYRKNRWKEADPRNVLGVAFAELAIHISPEVIVMENVPEMFSERYWPYWLSIREIFEQSGYCVRAAIYETATFGVPQFRYRALAIASRIGINLPPRILDHHEYRTVRDAIGNLPVVVAGEAWHKDPLHQSSAHKATTLDVIKAVPKNGGSRPLGIGPPCLDKVQGFFDVYGRLAWDRPSITITQYSRNPASGRFTHPESNRGLTIREAARLQSFPDGFRFEGGRSAAYKQIGEAVPPLFAAAVATWVVDCLDGKGHSDPGNAPPEVVAPLRNNQPGRQRARSERQ